MEKYSKKNPTRSANKIELKIVFTKSDDGKIDSRNRLSFIFYTCYDYIFVHHSVVFLLIYYLK